MCFYFHLYFLPILLSFDSCANPLLLTSNHNLLSLSEHPIQWSRSKPSYEFQFEGLSNFSPWKVGSNPRHQSKNIEMKYKTHFKLVHESYDTCFEYNVIIKNRPSDCTSCSVACWWADYIEDFKWRLHFQFRVVFWRVVFERHILKGIEDQWSGRTGS